jgi:hypothetical protein
VLLERITGNVCVDSVWAEYVIDDGPLLRHDVTSAGRDSFVVGLGGGLLPGQILRSRIVARDRSAAHNLAYSKADFESLTVGTVWQDDFENGGYGYDHGGWSFTYRDAWHLTTESSSPPGGASWKCGADDTIPYPPHVDAVLSTPVLTGLAPGARMAFAHRYDLEQRDAQYAWDGARLEYQIGNGAWQVLTPDAGYTHLVRGSYPLEHLSPCWSGDSHGWRTEWVDLSPLGPGPARVRFRMVTDDLIAGAGWYVDRVRIYPDGVVGVPPEASVTRSVFAGVAPNPSRGAVTVAFTLAGGKPTSVAWSLFDVAGRRVPGFDRGSARVAPGSHTASLTLPAELPNGLYFVALALDGHPAGVKRLALVR